MVATLSRMGRKKLDNRTPRKPLQMPEPWYQVLQELVKHKKRPKLWILIEYMAEDAKRLGIPTPGKMPWETTAE